MYKSLIAAILALSITGCSTANYTIGIGYKIQEFGIYDYDTDTMLNDPITARFKVHWEYKDNWDYGMTHHSQWFTGEPFSKHAKEYSKTEVFLDYKF